jgi:hypothetical protein
MNYIFKILCGLGTQVFGRVAMDATSAEGYILFLLGFLVAAHIINEHEK